MKLPSHDMQNFMLNLLLCLMVLAVIANIIYAMVR